MSVCVGVQSLSHVRLFETPWTAARQAPLPMEFLRQEYGSGLPFPPPGIFLTQISNLHLLHWQVGFLPLSYLQSPWMGIWILKCLIDRVKKASIMAAMAIITNV